MGWGCSTWLSWRQKLKKHAVTLGLALRRVHASEHALGHDVADEPVGFSVVPEVVALGARAVLSFLAASPETTCLFCRDVATKLWVTGGVGRVELCLDDLYAVGRSLFVAVKAGDWDRHCHSWVAELCAHLLSISINHTPQGHVSTAQQHADWKSSVGSTGSIAKPHDCVEVSTAISSVKR